MATRAARRLGTERALTLAGFLRGLGASTATAALTRPTGACCVELVAAGTG